MATPDSIIDRSRQHRLLAVFAGALLLLSALPCLAQSVPDTAASDAPRDAAASQAAPKRRVGDATTELLTLQESGAAAGKTLPMLGATTGLSWQRYQDSFKFKIPESFKTKVESPTTNR